MKSLFGRSVLLAASIALLASTTSSSSHHSKHSAKLRTHIHLPWSTGTTSADNTTASHSSSPPPASTPAPPAAPGVTNLISIKDHALGDQVEASAAEKERVRKISLANSPYKAEPPAYPAQGDDIKQFLHEHNRKREKHGLSALKWDNKLAKIAADWLPHLRPHCGLLHSPAADFRSMIKGDVANYPQLGENLMAHYGSSDTTIAKAVQSWIDEEQCYKYGPIGAEGTTYGGPNCKMEKDKEQSGHYTQLMSDTATHLGCASYYCGKKQFLTNKFTPTWWTGFGYIYACEYGNANGGPAGNAQGSFPFSKKVAKNIQLPFLGHSSPIPPIDMGSGAGASAGRNPLLDFYNIVDGKYVAKTPAELAAAAAAKVPGTAVKGGKSKGGKSKNKNNKGKNNKGGKNKKMLMLASLQSEDGLLRGHQKKHMMKDDEDDAIDTSLMQVSDDNDDDDDNEHDKLDDDDELFDNGEALYVNPSDIANNDGDNDTDSDEASIE